MIRTEKTCYPLGNVRKGKKYLITFEINGDFHGRLCIQNESLTEHKEFLTVPIYSGAGKYTYVLTPNNSGVICFCESEFKKPEEQNWSEITNYSVEVMV